MSRIVSVLFLLVLAASASPRVTTDAAPPRAPVRQANAAQQWLDAYYAALRTPPPAVPSTRRVLVRVTACSPRDSKIDEAYYAKYGYEGSAYGIAAAYNQFPKGTRIRVPGYLETSYPGTFWEVDSRGGSVIRRSSARGIPHIDVKFRTKYSAQQWGNRWLWVDVIDSKDIP